MTVKQRKSKCDIMSMLSEIHTLAENDEFFQLDKATNPTGTHKCWDWKYGDESFKDLWTDPSYWLLKGIVIGLKFMKGDEPNDQENETSKEDTL